MSKITCTFSSRRDLEGLEAILILSHKLSIYNETIRKRLLKSVKKRLKENGT